MKHTLLFSDVHLKPSGMQRKSDEEFLAFLRSIDPQKVERLVCLGDLFDFWFEYRHVNFSGYFEILRAFADLRDQGLSLHLCCGNHDLWAGELLTRLTGFQVYHEPVHLDFGDRRALLLHGDGLNPKDKGYLLFKKVAANRVLQKIFRWVHPDLAMAFAQFLSRKSRDLLSTHPPAKGPEVMAVREYARQCIVSGSESLVICGHAHEPVIEEVEGPEFRGQYVNTGDWPIHRCYVCFDGTEFTIRSWC
ncbi:MAG: UDP-2,3-diacylglucosamine diphosphatase [Candidatus Hydrogenedens sp.]|jgi:UDP-2,3-diacylglucosamine hydrolase|nr:UDP-2,3-diacylglucosamine diphosphatase [Candidatus Hydrogenedens sp.]